MARKPLSKTETEVALSEETEKKFLGWLKRIWSSIVTTSDRIIFGIFIFGIVLIFLAGILAAVTATAAIATYAAIANAFSAIGLSFVGLTALMLVVRVNNWIAREATGLAGLFLQLMLALVVVVVAGGVYADTLVWGAQRISKSLNTITALEWPHWQWVRTETVYVDRVVRQELPKEAQEAIKKFDSLNDRAEAWMRENPRMTYVLSSASTPNAVAILCEHPGYRGWCQYLAEGEYDIIPSGLSFIRVLDGYEVIIFKQPQRKGEGLIVRGTTDFTSSKELLDGWNDKAESAWIRRIPR